jgi:very-short-patch-repair endonuclease
LETDKTRQERREKKKQKKREKILQHGHSLVRVYKDAVLKQAKQVCKEDKPKDS